MQFHFTSSSFSLHLLQFFHQYGLHVKRYQHSEFEVEESNREESSETTENATMHLLPNNGQ